MPESWSETSTKTRQIAEKITSYLRQIRNEVKGQEPQRRRRWPRSRPAESLPLCQSQEARRHWESRSRKSKSCLRSAGKRLSSPSSGSGEAYDPKDPWRQQLVGEAQNISSGEEEFVAPGIDDDKESKSAARDTDQKADRDGEVEGVSSERHRCWRKSSR